MANIEKLSENLLRRGYQVSCFDTAAEACAHLNAAIDGVSVGFGGSVTVRELGLYEQLAQHNQCYWHWCSCGGISPQAACADVYICSLNAVSENGELINIDGAGNRVSSTLYGHKKVCFIIGQNKIAPDYDAALWRARNIAAPLNAKRLGTNTPCVKTGRCMDCSSPERICSALVVLWEKPSLCGDVEIVIVREDLGY